MELRVEALAARAGVSVDTVRYYQARNLLHPPRREGRVAWYDETHLERLRRVRGLQARGFSLATIARILGGELDAADEALVGALAAEASPAGAGPLLTLGDLAERTGVPVPVLQAVVAEGLLVPQRVGDQAGYTEEDVAAARAGLAILGWGIPLSDLLQLATAHHRAMTDIARRAVDLFDTHVRHAARDDPDVDPQQAAERMVEAFHTLLPAAATLVGHHFTRVLLAEAMDHIERVGSGAERDAVGVPAALSVAAAATAPAAVAAAATASTAAPAATTGSAAGRGPARRRAR